jgi:hypothetical protein
MNLVRPLGSYKIRIICEQAVSHASYPSKSNVKTKAMQAITDKLNVLKNFKVSYILPKAISLE